MRRSNNNGEEFPKEQNNKKGEAAKQLLKSLITLDSYENDMDDANTPIQDLQASADEKSNNNEGESMKSKEDLEFEKKEAERDAAIPPEYRKFRPRGYGFRLPPTDRPVRVYADGVFDLFHAGHMKQLEQAKKSLPNVTMVVGVPNDELTHKYKGLTVLTDEQRYESLRHCKWVDEVIPNAPWVVTQDFLDEHKIDYVAHDDEPYAGPNGEGDVYQFVKEQGRFLTTQRTDGISTSDIITKIIKDYDLYLMRNFKRGVSRKDLNVSWMKKNELDIKRHVNAFRQSWKNNVKTTSQDLYADLLAYALNKPENSVLGRATKWVTRKIDNKRLEAALDAYGENNSRNTSASNSVAPSAENSAANSEEEIDEALTTSNAKRRKITINDKDQE